MSGISFDDLNARTPLTGFGKPADARALNLSLQRASVGWLLLAALLLVVVPQNGAVAFQPDKNSTSDTPEEMTDLLVVPTEEGIYIYIADEDRGVIFRKKIPADRYGSVRLDEGGFERVFAHQKYKKPHAMAYKDGKLIISDGEADELIEIDTMKPESQEPNKLPGIKTKEPGSVATLGGDSLLTVDRNLISLYNFKKNEQAALPFTFPGPARIAVDGAMLYILDKKEETIYSTKIGDPLSTSDQGVGVLGYLAGDLRSKISRLASDSEAKHSQIKDFDVRDGCYYAINEILDRKEIILFTESGVVLPVIFKDSEQINPSRIRTTEADLFIADSAGHAVWRVKRPIPVEVSVKSNLKNSTDAIFATYEYLSSKDLLPRETFKADRNMSLHQILLEQDILPANISGSEYTEARRKIEELICALNKDFCSLQRQRKGSLLEHILEKGQKLVLPKVNLKAIQSTGLVSLNNKSVKEYLKERVPLVDIRTDFNDAYLVNLNPSLFLTIEGELSRRGFIAATPPLKSLNPGTIFQTHTGGDEVSRERVSGRLSECIGNLVYNEEGDKTNLPLRMRGQSVLPYIPVKNMTSTSQLNPGLVEKLKPVKRIEIRFENPSIERLDVEAAEESLKDNTMRSCASLKIGSGVFVVLEALKVQKAIYTLKGADGFEILFTKEELEQFNIDALPDPDGVASFVVDSPLYIGYKAGGLNENFVKDIGYFKQPLTAAAVKPYSKQNILNLSTGVFRLPYTYWKLTALVNLEDYEATNSPLRQINTPDKGVKLELTRRYSSRGSSYSLSGNSSISRDEEETDFTQVKKDREDLKKAINFPTKEELGDITVQGILDQSIGILEPGDTVDRDHSDFISKDSASSILWSKTEQSGALAGADRNPKRIKKQFKREQDHGTYVAGIIAASEDSELPGLLPAQLIVLIDSNQLDRLPSLLSEAVVDAHATIFNFSQEFKDQSQANGNDDEVEEEKRISDIKKEITENYKDLLFILASGNCKVDCEVKDIKRPISWAHKSKHMIGVGATDLERNLLSSSTYSKKYIQLVAPGARDQSNGLFGQSYSNSYARASGTSFAAPLVTVAARLLFLKTLGASSIKARLIYTSDWRPEYIDKVWGGFLNVGRAYRDPDKDLIKTSGMSKEMPVSILPHRTNVKIINSEARFYDVDRKFDEALKAINKEIPFHNILRITPMDPQSDNGLYRVIYFERPDNTTRARLRIVMNARFEDGARISCVAPTGDPGECSRRRGEGIHIGNIIEYVGSLQRLNGLDIEY